MTKFGVPESTQNDSNTIALYTTGGVYAYPASGFESKLAFHYHAKVDCPGK